MSPFVVLALCLQACLIQSAMSQCCGSRTTNLAPAVTYGSLGPNLGSCGCGFGGTGKGEVVAVGDVSACGQTCVVGSVPAIGEASFSGCLPATGCVTITGECGCGCV